MKRTFVTLGLVLLTLLTSCEAIRGPKYVAKITVVNPYEYSFHVEVGDGRSGWLNLGGVTRNGENSMEEVIDMGSTWHFRFRFSDQEEEEITIARDELQARRWRIDVPEAISKRLRARGEPPSYKP